MGGPGWQDFVIERKKFIAFARDHGLTNLCRVLFNLNEFTFAD